MNFNFRPVTRIRPSRSNDGEGGYTEVLNAGVTIYARMDVHDSEVSAIVRNKTDVRIGDLIEITDRL